MGSASVPDEELTRCRGSMNGKILLGISGDAVERELHLRSLQRVGIVRKSPVWDLRGADPCL